MKVNGTMPNRKVIFRDAIPDVGVFRKLKFQAPNFNEIPIFSEPQPGQAGRAGVSNVPSMSWQPPVEKPLSEGRLK
jgi:hypothetical protein